MAEKNEEGKYWLHFERDPENGRLYVYHDNERIREFITLGDLPLDSYERWKHRAPMPFPALASNEFSGMGPFEQNY